MLLLILVVLLNPVTTSADACSIDRYRSYYLPQSLLSTTLWETSLPLKEPHADSECTLVAKDYLLCITKDLHLIGVSLLSGEITWRNPIPVKAARILGATDQFAFLATQDGKLLTYSIQTGRSLWQRNDLAATAPHCVTKDALIIQSAKSKVLRLRPDTGRELWRLQKKNLTAIAATSEVLCMVDDTSNLEAYDLDSEEPLWANKESCPAVTLVRVDQNRFATLLVDGNVICFRATNGTTTWKQRIELHSSISEPQLYPALGTILVLRSAWTDAFCALSSTNGRKLWQWGQYPVSSPAFTGPLMLYSTNDYLCIQNYQTNILSFSCKTGLPYSYYKTNSNTLLVTTPSGALLSEQIDPKALFTVKETPDISYPPYRRAVALGMISFVSLCLMTIFIVKLLRGTTAQVLPLTTYAKTRFYSCYFVAVVYALLLAYCGVFGLWVCATRQYQTLLMANSLILLLPSLGLIAVDAASLLLLPRRFLLHRQCAGTPGSKNDTKTQVQTLAKAMGIHTPIYTYFSLPENTSPRITRTIGFGNSLVLPKNFTAMIHISCFGNVLLEQALTKFVITHELAHIKNRDLRLLPFRRTVLFWWLPTSLFLVFLAILIEYTTWLPFYLTLQSQLYLPFSCLTMFLLIVHSFFIAERENLADALAGLHIHPDELKTLTQQQTLNDGEIAASPLQNFILLITSNRHRRSKHHYFMPTIAKDPARHKYILFAHFLGHIGTRISEIARKYRVFITYDRAQCFGGALMAGALMAFAYESVEILHNAIMLTIGTQIAPLNTDAKVEFAIRGLEWWHQTYPNNLLLKIVDLHVIVLFSVVSLLTAFLPVMQLRYFCNFSIRKRLFLILTQQLVLSGVFILFVLVFVQMNDNILIGGRDKLFILCFCVLSVVAVVLVSFIVHIENEYVTIMSQFMRNADLIPLFAVTWAFLLYILWPLGALSALLVSTVVLLLPLTATMLFQKPYFAFVIMNTDGLRWTQVWKYRMVSNVDVLPGNPGYLRRFLHSTVMVTGVAFVSISIAIVLFPFLIGLNSAVTEIAPYINIRTSSNATLGRNLNAIAYLIVTFLPGGTLLTPSAILGFYALILIVSVIVLITIREWYRAQRDSEWFLERLLSIVELSAFTSQPWMNVVYKESLKLIFGKSSKQPYLMSIGQRTPLFSLTCRALSAFQKSLDCSLSSQMTFWILQHSNKGGGFGPAVNISSDVSATAVALRAVGSGLSQAELAEHGGWAIRELRALLERRALRKRGVLYLRNLALLAEIADRADALNSLAPEVQKEMFESASAAWWSGTKSISETYSWVSIAKTVGEKIDVCTVLKEKWLSAFMPLLPALSPFRHTRDICEFILILEFVLGDDGLQSSEAQQALDNLRLASREWLTSMVGSSSDAQCEPT